MVEIARDADLPFGTWRSQAPHDRRFPYAVLFLAEGDHVEVLAVFHSSRDPREWRSRV